MSAVLSFCSRVSLVQIFPPLEDNSCREQRDLKVPRLTSALLFLSPRHEQTGPRLDVVSGAPCVFVLLQAGWKNLTYSESSSASSQPHLVVGLALDAPRYQGPLQKKSGFLAHFQATELPAKRSCTQKHEGQGERPGRLGKSANPGFFVFKSKRGLGTGATSDRALGDTLTKRFLQAVPTKGSTCM